MQIQRGKTAARAVRSGVDRAERVRGPPCPVIGLRRSAGGRGGIALEYKERAVVGMESAGTGACRPARAPAGRRPARRPARRADARVGRRPVRSRKARNRAISARASRCPQHHPPAGQLPGAGALSAEPARLWLYAGAAPDRTGVPGARGNPLATLAGPTWRNWRASAATPSTWPCAMAPRPSIWKNSPASKGWKCARAWGTATHSGRHEVSARPCCWMATRRNG